MKKMLLNILKLSISLGVGVGLIIWFTSKLTAEQKQQTINAFMRADYFWIILAPLLGILSNLSRAQRWRLLLEPTGHKPSFWNTVFSIQVMYFFNLFFPRLGEVTRCSVLARYENVPLDKSIGTMVVERLVDLISIALIGGVLLVVEYDRLFNYFVTHVLNKPSAPANQTNYTPYYILIGGLVIALLAILFLHRKYGLHKVKTLAKERLMGFVAGLLSIKDLKHPVEFIFHSVFIWVCYFLMIYISFKTLPETAGLGIFAGMACLFMGGFAMVATPGGIGVYPLAIQQVLALYLIDSITGYAFGSLVWGVQMAGVLVAGVLSLLLLAILNREPSLNT